MMNVRELREAKKHSRKALSQLTGIKEGRIWALENGKEPTSEEHATLQYHLLGAMDAPVPTEPVEILPLDDPIPAHPSSDIPMLVMEPEPIEEPTSEPSDHSEASIADRLVVPSTGGGPERREGLRLISNSEIQTFKQCRRKWWLGWYRGLMVKNETPFGARAIGLRLHRALKMYYVPKQYEPMDPMQALERLITEDWSALTANGFTEEFRKKFDQEANLERAMMEGYWQWIQEEAEDADLEILEPEAYLEATLLNKSDLDPADKYNEVRIIGRLDARALRRSDGIRLFIDHKSVQSLTAPVRTLTLDEQMLHYHLLEFLNTEEADKRCEGALYNMLRKVKRGPTAKPPFFDRVPVRHNPREIESYQRRLTAVVDDILDVEGELDSGANHLDVAYPTPSRDCSWKCDFLSICGMFDDGSRVEAMIEQYYMEHDPLEYYDVKEES
jgi:transcriptional regulator with XRE-family HTH domain